MDRKFEYLFLISLIFSLFPFVFAESEFENDYDRDGVPDDVDNCPNYSNSNQIDSDGDGIGNRCDKTPYPSPDIDNDGVDDQSDNCPLTPNNDQLDSDQDGIGDKCDYFENIPPHDLDDDGIPDVIDNCPYVSNHDQADSDQDNVGDVCDEEFIEKPSSIIDKTETVDETETIPSNNISEKVFSSIESFFSSPVTIGITVFIGVIITAAAFYINLKRKT